MHLPRVAESVYVKRARSKLLADELLLGCVHSHMPPDRKKVILDYWDTSKRISFLRENLSRALNRGDKAQRVEIDQDYCFSVGEAQNWLCNISGDQMEFDRGGTYWGNKWCNPKSCTIDRIDSNKGYVKGNIQLVTWEVNCLKQHFENEYFIDFCKKVAEHNK